MCDAIYYAFSSVFGLIIGSFLNALIWRLKNKKSMLRTRSVCPKCGHVLAWHDLIPVFSYVLLDGKCRYCGKKISIQYPLVEAATAALFVLAVFVYGPENISLIFRAWFFISLLIVIFTYDLLWGEILDKITLPAIIMVLSINLLLGCGWAGLFMGAGIGFVFFLLQFLASKGRWLGGGDVRMGALMGFMVGWPNILVALFAAYIVGAAVAMPLLFAGRKKLSSKIPLGTFLALGTLVALFWGEEIIAWYLNF